MLAHSITVPGMTAAICRDYCSDKDALFYATQVGLRACRNAPWQGLLSCPTEIVSAVVWGTRRRCSSNSEYSSSEHVQIISYP